MGGLAAGHGAGIAKNFKVPEEVVLRQEGWVRGVWAAPSSSPFANLMCYIAALPDATNENWPQNTHCISHLLAYVSLRSFLGGVCSLHVHEEMHAPLVFQDVLPMIPLRNPCTPSPSESRAS